eukprot:m.86803 g.86803  ORF g.86803 m.86803 type:complete len:1080 (+) comp14888_c0_seq1:58-3297(+)
MAATRYGGTLFADSTWRQSVASLRLNPAKFLAGHKLDSHDFVVDLVAVILADNVGEETKTELFVSLPDVLATLNVSPQDLAHTINSLQALFKRQSGPQMLKSQVLITITELMICNNFCDVHQSTFQRFVDLLVEKMTVNQLAAMTVRRTACQCLHELELSWPGMLASKLGYLFAMCQEEKTHIGQEYVALFATGLRHATQLLHHDEQPPDILSTARGALQPFVYEPCVLASQPEQALFSDAGSIKQLPQGRTDDLKRAISFLVESSSQLSPPALLFVFARLIECVHAAGVSPKGFTDTFSRLVAAADPSTVHVLLLLKVHFGDDLVDPASDRRLFERLARNVNHPALSSELRALSLCWAWRCRLFPLLSSDVPPFFDVAPYLFPDICDLPQLLAPKVDALIAVVLGACGDSKASGFRLPGELLVALRCFDSFPAHGPAGWPVQGLYRSLLWLYLGLADTTVGEEVYGFVLQTALKYPKFLTNTVDLAEAVLRHAPGSDFLQNILATLVRAIVRKSTKSIVAGLMHFLVLFERAGREKLISPTTYLVRLYDVLRVSDVCKQGRWAVGDAILGVCRTLLCHQPTPVILKPLGDLLYLLWTSFNDIDIRDHARFYYMVLTNVSGEHLLAILAPSSDPNMTHVVSSGMLGTSTSFPKAKPIRAVPQVFFTVARCPMVRSRTLVQLPAFPGMSKLAAAAAKDGAVLRAYLEALPTLSAEAAVELHYEVRYVPRSQLPAQYAPPDQCLAMNLEFQPTADFEQPGVVHVPVLVHDASHDSAGRPGSPGSMTSLSTAASSVASSALASPVKAEAGDGGFGSGDGGVSSEGNADDGRLAPSFAKITVRLRPRQPTPTTLKVSVEFTEPSGLSSRGPLRQLSVAFEDLFSEPVLPGRWGAATKEAERVLLRGLLFAQLWEHGQQHLRCGGGGSDGAGSDGAGRVGSGGGASMWADGLETVKRLHVPRDTLLPALATHLGRFMVPREGPLLLVPAMVADVDGGSGGGGSGPAGQGSSAAAGGGGSTPPTQHHRAFVFIPPRFHVLLTFDVAPDATLVSLLTDNWRMVPFVDKFLTETLDHSSSTPKEEAL